MPRCQARGTGRMGPVPRAEKEPRSGDTVAEGATQGIDLLQCRRPDLRHRGVPLSGGLIDLVEGFAEVVG
jgi:hypothetical protein